MSKLQPHGRLEMKQLHRFLIDLLVDTKKTMWMMDSFPSALDTVSETTFRQDLLFNAVHALQMVEESKQEGQREKRRVRHIILRVILLLFVCNVLAVIAVIVVWVVRTKDGSSWPCNGNCLR